jgi:hypothetical protein
MEWLSVDDERPSIRCVIWDSHPCLPVSGEDFGIVFADVADVVRLEHVCCDSRPEDGAVGVFWGVHDHNPSPPGFI